MYDFAGPYTIGKGGLAFGPPTRYLQVGGSYPLPAKGGVRPVGDELSLFSSLCNGRWPVEQLDVRKCRAPEADWDTGVMDGCETYSKRMHNLVRGVKTLWERGELPT